MNGCPNFPLIIQQNTFSDPSSQGGLNFQVFMAVKKSLRYGIKNKKKIWYNFENINMGSDRL